MKFERHGKNILKAEVTNVSAHGFWLLLDTKEKFVAFGDFPWFRSASIGEITNVEWLSADHLYWPALDIDIAVESLDHPELFPIVSNAPKVLLPKDRQKRFCRVSNNGHVINILLIIQAAKFSTC